TATLKYRQADPTALCGVCLRAKSQLQTFLNQASQARALLGGQCFGIGEELIVEVQGGLHGKMIQISVRSVEGCETRLDRQRSPCRESGRSGARKQPAPSDSS